MRTRIQLLVVAALTLLVAGDLPSCLRARCSHCSIQFIAQMCPATCGQCGSDIGAATRIQTTPVLHNVARQTSVAAHGQPIYTGPAPTQNFPPPGPPRGLPPPQVQQGQVHSYTYNGGYGANSVVQPQAAQLGAQPTQYGHSYLTDQSPPQAAPIPAPQPGQVLPPAPQFLPTPAPQTIYPPPQPQYPGFGAPQQPFGAPAQPAPGFGQPFGAPPPAQGFGSAPGQPGQSAVFNPFQPFLGQTFQAQQPFNPFTLPTLPPSATFAPFTVAPPAAPTPSPTLPPLFTLPPPPSATLAPPAQPFQPQFPQAPQAPQAVQTPQLPQQPPAAFQPQPQQQLQGGYAAQQPQQVGQVPPAEPQRPRQVFSQLPEQVQPRQPVQQPTPAQYVPQQPAAAAVPQQPYPAQPQQPYPAQPQAPQQQAYLPQPAAQQQQVAQPSTSIDATPVQVDKNNYILSKGAGAAAGGTCPKQPNWEPCISKELANDRFRNCCQRLGEGCAQLCSYDSNLATIQLAVLTGRCPISKVADMMVCASGYEDATPCCQAYNVFEPGFEHCRPYCNPAAGLPQDGMLAEKYRCLGKLSQIQRCFYVSQRP